MNFTSRDFFVAAPTVTAPEEGQHYMWRVAIRGNFVDFDAFAREEGTKIVPSFFDANDVEAFPITDVIETPEGVSNFEVVAVNGRAPICWECGAPMAMVGKDAAWPTEAEYFITYPTKDFGDCCRYRTGIVTWEDFE